MQLFADELTNQNREYYKVNDNAFYLYVTSMYLCYRIHSLSNIFKTEQDIKPLFIYFYTLSYSVINITVWPSYMI